MEGRTGITPLDKVEVSSTVRAMPKVDLHVHAEAGPRLQRILALRSGGEPYDWREWMAGLSKEAAPGMPRIKSMAKELISPEDDASPQNFRARIVDALVDEASAGAIYAEIRFGRDTVLRHDFVPLFREAEELVRGKFPDFAAEPLATLMLEFGGDQIDRLVAACVEASAKGLVGVDILSDPYVEEADWTDAYRWSEELASAGLGITVHAAEFSTANLSAALKLPGISRLGHAVFAGADEQLFNDVLKSGVAIESCLTSNVVLGAVESFETHPLRAFIDGGIPVTLNTDDPVRLNTTIEREYALAAQLGLSDLELIDLTRNAVRYSFTSKDRKERLFARLDSHILAAC